jgi:hypothetical protein
MSALTLPRLGEAANGALRYEQHRPEQTTLYRLVQQHAASFIAHTEASTGSELPRFIKDEFDAFLECGILAHGFLRLRCGECGHDRLLAFSCKRRGFCPSCGARRMSQTAAHLVDHVIPRVPVRQWGAVSSMPAPVASGWSIRRVGLAPTGKRRLCTAHANCGPNCSRSESPVSGPPKHD